MTFRPLGLPFRFGHPLPPAAPCVGSPPAGPVAGSETRQALLPPQRPFLDWRWPPGENGVAHPMPAAFSRCTRALRTLLR